MTVLSVRSWLPRLIKFYQVALKRFIDGVAIEVIETNLIKPLADIFAPLLVFDMADDLATRIAGESIENKSLRDQLSRKLHILRKGSETCRMFIGIRGLGKSLAHPERQCRQLMK